MPGQKLPELLRQAVLLRDGGACVYCGQAWGQGRAIEVDHLQSRAWGGGNEPLNLAAACEDCNNLKGTADLEAFATMSERYGRIPDAAALIARVRAQVVRPLDWARAAELLKMRK